MSKTTRLTIELDSDDYRTTFTREIKKDMTKEELLYTFREAALAFGYQINELIEKE